ncbi:hypothetical protein [Phocicoccus pinnipedialis]|uniref:Uncharacterized protein n=1 Tax=Phocicoccus pinnipedialis TaxID=110845 RepID=A0A6V7QZS1_9BACL|nr:hypothetical protein [Jeotgalicoccus pinnipedialis]MBP1938719.1 hypothetical protein [Jeotgalicoccus pinnipedialis]CAD2070520.1 hypothetical protein JEOPIN946_00029 [Jeotgalicoccus pinnipedialis]
MFKFDRDTKPYHLTNLVFYLFTLVVLCAIYYFGFLPPLLDAVDEGFFTNFGLRELGGSLFFLILVIVPLALIAGIIYHTKGFLNPETKAHVR